ncbi:hypothetical protein NDU88_005686 [Pleurodeles waltl]|uniref:Uncharacterized protein n=1 Tax=Pleurodeles waltl TaxID=8319 RepID=A0AAV7VMG0_PLEWA|nr:hypothetical protein NDU88_005686 [Pleurodeles waltl]
MHSLPCGEKFTARQTGMREQDFTRRRAMWRLRCDQNFNARPTRLTHSLPGMTQPNFQRGNRCSARHAEETTTQCPPERRTAGDFAPQA